MRDASIRCHPALYFFPRALTDILRCLTKCLLNRAGSPKIMVLVVLTCNKACILYNILSLTVQKRKTSRISSVYAGFETFFIVNRYAYVAPSFWKNRMKGARARLSLIPGAEFSTRAYLSYKRLSYFFVCLHMFLIFAIGINSFVVSNPKAWCRESVSSLRL